MSKDYSLSLRGEAFNSLCADFDTTLRDVLAGMIETEQNTGEINIKVKITLTDDSAPDYTVAGGHQTREVTKPKFDHTVAYVIQRKEKKSGSFSGNFELVFDKASGQYFYPPEFRSVGRTRGIRRYARAAGEIRKEGGGYHR